MKIQFVCPHWGQEELKPSMFFARLLGEQYEGVEINLSEDSTFTQEFLSCVGAIRAAKRDFVFIAQQVLPPAQETVDEYIIRMNARLKYLVSLKPDFINSHTGKDFFSFDDNCRIIEAVENIAATSGISILHETHRGRFTFHAASLLRYLEKFPDLKLTGDFSHWCAVSESMLEDQQDILEKIIPHIHHIHARVGFEHGPQVNDPFAPEWKSHLETFVKWWDQIVHLRGVVGTESLTITPEFGPVPYMPTMPYSQKPLADQWKVNAQIRDVLQAKFEIKELNKMRVQ